MTEQKLSTEIAGIECKHVGYVVSKDRKHDLLTVKEVINYTDGRRETNLRLLVDFKRPFYIDRAANAPPGSHGTYKDKREWQDLDKLQPFTSTQVDLANSIYRALNPNRVMSRPMRLREVCRSPYVYGADITTPTLVKHHYMERWPDYNGAGKASTPLSVTMLDTETDMVRGTGEIIMLTIAEGPKVYSYIQSSFLKTTLNPEQDLQAAFHFYLGEYKAKRNIDYKVFLCKDAAEVVTKSLAQLHLWRPDIVAIWNMNFDIPKMLAELKNAGLDAGDYWSDPSVPKDFREVTYREGSSQKVTQAGKTMPLPPFDRWHTLVAPASFQVIDAMCLYRKLRFAKGMENGYSLDAVLERNLGIRKLKFSQADKYLGARWHAFMQANYPVEYCVYNAFDCISMQELDEKTGDISHQLNIHSGHSEYSVFSSQPTRTWDDLCFECIKVNKIAASTSDKMRDEFDELTTPLGGLIVTLPSHQVHHTGIQACNDWPDYHTLLWGHVADLDIAGTYPTTEGLMNISKETTSKEILKIEGLDEITQRSLGINLTGGRANSVEICLQALKAPSFDTLLADYLATKGVEHKSSEVVWQCVEAGDTEEAESEIED